jgi:hypothetical protein
MHGFSGKLKKKKEEMKTEVRLLKGQLILERKRETWKKAELNRLR